MLSVSCRIYTRRRGGAPFLNYAGSLDNLASTRGATKGLIGRAAAMRIVCWNVNGLRTIKGYQPWYKLKDWQACLEHLQADIACFQETKMTRKQLEQGMALMPAYHAFFNFHPTKGYSGTVTYTRKDVCVPLKAEQGITGRLVPPKEVEAGQAIGSNPTQCRDDIEVAEFAQVDNEGRAVMVDCGLFVLFNLYCPNETGPERLSYKMSYYHCLAERAHNLLRAGRQVIIVGDMNIVRAPIDHCDPVQKMKEQGLTEFTDHPARRWFNDFLAPQGQFIDICRKLQPDRQKMYTCWNTVIDARPVNYGTRLDYVLISPDLEPWVKACDIQPEIYGSDHCPVYIDLLDERVVDGKTVRLRDLMNAGAEKIPPPLAACNYDEFSGKQRKLATFFSNSGVRNKTQAQASPSAQPKQDALGDALTGEPIHTRNGAQSASAGVIPPQSYSTASQSTTNGELSLADAFDILQAPRPQEETLPDPNISQPTSSPPFCTPASTPAASSPTPPYSFAGAANPSNRSTVASTVNSAKPATPKSPSAPALKRARSASSKGKTTTAAQSKKGGQQMNLKSFFGNPSAGAASTDLSGACDAMASTSKLEAEPASAAASAPEPEPELRASSSQTSATDPALFLTERDFATSSSLASASGSVSSDGDSDSGPSAAARVGASLAWGAIFTPRAPPLCKMHNEPAKSWTVNKPGPNHGRKFWLCARPVGPGYEKGGARGGEVGREFRCDYFAWDSNFKRGPAMIRGGASGKGAAGGSETGQAFNEAAAQASKAKNKNNLPHGADDEGPHKRVRTAR